LSAPATFGPRCGRLLRRKIESGLWVSMTRSRFFADVSRARIVQVGKIKPLYLTVGPGHSCARRNRQTLADERNPWMLLLDQLGGKPAAPDRWVFTVGKFSVTDIFDMNRLSHHDPPAQADFLLNWGGLSAVRRSRPSTMRPPRNALGLINPWARRPSD